MNNCLFALTALIVPILTDCIPTGRKGLMAGLFLSLVFPGRSSVLLLTVPLSALIIIFYNMARPSLSCTSLLENKWPIWEKSQLRLSSGPAFPLFILFAISLTSMSAMTSGAAVPEASPVFSVAGSAGSIFFGLLCDRRNAFTAALYLVFLQEVSICLAASGASSYSSALISLLAALCTGGFFTVFPLVSRSLWGFGRSLSSYLMESTCVFALWVLIGGRCARAQDYLLDSPDFQAGVLMLAVLSVTFLYVSWKRRLFLVTRRRVRGG